MTARKQRTTFFLGALIVILLIFGGYLTYKLKTTPRTPNTQIADSEAQNPIFDPNIDVTQTVTNRVVTDNTNHYTFSFPLDWQLILGNPNQIFNFDPQELNDQDLDPETDSEKIALQIWSTPGNGASFETFLVSREQALGEGTPIEYEDTTIAGEPAKMRVETFDDNYQVLLIYLQNPKTKDFITITASPRYDLNENEINTILSTVSFTD